MANSDSNIWPTKPVDKIVSRGTFAAMQAFDSAEACILERERYPRFQFDRTVRQLTATRSISTQQADRLKAVLTSPESYWIGNPKFRRLPPRPNFLFVCPTATYPLYVAVDLINPGWSIFYRQSAYWGFMFAGLAVRAIAKELFPEFASPSKGSMWARGSLPTTSWEAKFTDLRSLYETKHKV